MSVKTVATHFDCVAPHDFGIIFKWAFSTYRVCKYRVSHSPKSSVLLLRLISTFSRQFRIGCVLGVRAIS